MPNSTQNSQRQPKNLTWEISRVQLTATLDQFIKIEVEIHRCIDAEQAEPDVAKCRNLDLDRQKRPRESGSLTPKDKPFNCMPLEKEGRVLGCEL